MIDRFAPRTQLFEPGQGHLGLFSIFVKVDDSGFSNGVQFLRTIGGPHFGQAHLLKERERWVDYAGAWRIGATGTGFDLADEIVAVSRLHL